MNIVLIHGMYMNDLSWEGWVALLRAKGHTVSTPVWPFHAGDPATLRANPDPALGKLQFKDILAHVRTFLREVPKPFVLVGHSMGGLVVQKLINEDMGVAGVCIDTAPPRGVVTFIPSFWKGNWPHVNPFAGNAPCHMTPERFQYTFCTTMSMDETRRHLDHYVVPESRNVPRSTLTAQGAIDFQKPHPPLLFIAGEKDTIIPWQLNKSNARAYTDKGSVTDFKIFPNRTHFICGQEGWQEVAEYVEKWVGEHVR